MSVSGDSGPVVDGGRNIPQEQVREAGFDIQVRRLPKGAGKWNRVEHRTTNFLLDRPLQRSAHRQSPNPAREHLHAAHFEGSERKRNPTGRRGTPLRCTEFLGSATTFGSLCITIDRPDGTSEN